MNESLDLASLEMVRTWAAGVLQREERRKHFEDLQKGLMESMQSMQRELVPDMLAGPESNMRKSVLALERSLSEMGMKQKKAEEELENLLKQAENRTRSLERWLEAIS